MVPNGRQPQQFVVTCYDVNHYNSCHNLRLQTLTPYSLSHKNYTVTMLNVDGLVLTLISKEQTLILSGVSLGR